MSKEKKVEQLAALYPNLYFSQYGVWIKRDGRDGEGTDIEVDLDNPNHEVLSEYNARAAKLFEIEGSFWCSCCQQVKIELHGQVFAGYFCTDCKDDEGVKNAIQESKRPGFYD